MSKNVYSLQLLRNGAAYETKEAAYNALRSASGLAGVNKKDGVAVLARYIDGNDIRTLVGYYAEASAMTEVGAAQSYMTIIDVEGSSADIEELKQKIGSGVTTTETVTKQLQDLSGDTASTSADTSVEGAKRYTEELIKTLDVDDTAVAKSFVIEVDETDGKIAVERGTITSSGKTVVLSDNADGGVNFEVNIDGETLIADSGTGVISVASAALVQYVGDEDTIRISDVDGNNNKTISSPLHLVKVTDGLPAEIKEEYRLVGASGTTIGDAVSIPKDSHIVSITYITDSGDTEHYQNLEYKYIDVSGNTRTEYVDMSALVFENEFRSGVTSTDGVVHGVVDATSETNSGGTAFLTVGADGFKVAGIKQEIIDRINELDATVGSQTIETDKHVAVEVVETDGKLTALTVVEDNIADADDLAELSAKTVTEIASSNDSITVESGATTAADGTVKYDIITDASKIQMSGFTAAESGFTDIAQSSSVTDAFKVVETYIITNEEVIAAALNDLNERIDELESGSTADLEQEIAARKAVDGQSGQTYAANTSANYISGATSLNDADIKLDTQLKAEQDEIDAIEAAVGLTSGGTYSANTTNTYTSAATSVADAVDKLDAAIKDVDDNMVSGATMNGAAVTKSDKSLSFSASTSNTTRSGDTAVIIDTNESTGALTFNLGTLDCGTYDI